MADSELPEGFENADRVVVSCVGLCTPDGGELRMDVVRGNTPTLIGNGGYGEFEQSCDR